MGTALKVMFAAVVLAARRGVTSLWPRRRRQRWFCRSDARRRFHWEREHLEARFVDLAQAAHHRGTARWTDCEFDDAVSYVLNRCTGQFLALVAINVTLPGRKAISNDLLGSNVAGGASPGKAALPAARVIRSATAVFLFDGVHWTTDGSVIFNLNPMEAIRFYRHDLEVVGET